MTLSRRTALAMLGATLLPAAGPGVATADGRIAPVSVWRATGRRAGTILFSHGALSSPAKYTALLAPWAAAGFDVWAPLHVDSTDHPDTGRYPGLASWAARIEDLRALAAHTGASSYVAAGHSYGGLVALALGGAGVVRPAGIAGPLADPRVRRVVALSPPGPMPGLVADYRGLGVPALVQTGTRDVPPGAPAGGWTAHLAAYDAAAPGGDRYALVLDGADHYFGGIICRPELPGPKQAAAFDAAMAVSLDFLRNDRAALAARLATGGAVRLARK